MHSVLGRCKPGPTTGYVCFHVYFKFVELKFRIIAKMWKVATKQLLGHNRLFHTSVQLI